MAYTLSVPPAYGLVVLGGGVAPFVLNIVLGGPVMSARSKYNVPYPNLYATPGVHDHADEFNRAQRSHQNFMEINDSYIAMTLLGGLKHPIACAVGSLCYCLGCFLFQKGYIDTSLDVKTARYKKGGGIKWVGVLLSLGSCVSLAVSMLSSA